MVERVENASFLNRSALLRIALLRFVIFIRIAIFSRWRILREVVMMRSIARLKKLTSELRFMVLLLCQFSCHPKKKSPPTHHPSLHNLSHREHFVNVKKDISRSLKSKFVTSMHWRIITRPSMPKITLCASISSDYNLDSLNLKESFHNHHLILT